MKIKEAIPYLSITDARKALEFYSEVFDCEPLFVLSMPDGRVVHCEFHVGDAKFFVFTGMTASLAFPESA